MNGVSIGIIDVTSISNYQFKIEDKYILKDIIRLIDPCDYKIIFYHGDSEYNFEPEKIKIYFARWCIDNGFDIFIGHHPHIIQPI